MMAENDYLIGKDVITKDAYKLERYKITLVRPYLGAS